MIHIFEKYCDLHILEGDEIFDLYSGLIFKYNSKGGFTLDSLPISGNRNRTIVPMNMDKDQNPDYLVRSFDGIYWHEKDSKGNWTSNSILKEEGGRDIEYFQVGDMDNDGDIDFFSCGDTGPSGIWENDGNGDFTYSGDDIIISAKPKEFGTSVWEIRSAVKYAYGILKEGGCIKVWMKGDIIYIDTVKC